jgi:hypothetical protein
MRRHLPCALMAIAAALLGRPARAFENQWHLGAEIGGAKLLGEELGFGPRAGAYAAYGLSDVFDARFGAGAFLASRNAIETFAAADVRAASAELGLAYKLDVIEWIPYAAALAGVAWTNVAPEGTSSVTEWAPALGVELGLDYAVSRELGLGLHYRAEAWLGAGAVDGAMSLSLAAEYRWGW